MSLKLPAYVYEDPEGKALREQIVQEVKLSEGDGRKAWLLQKTCETVFSKLSPKIQIDDLIKICMSDRACIVRSEAGLRTTLQEMFEEMQKQYYCQINRGPDGSCISVVLVEPWISKADDYLGRLYGRDKGYVYEKSQIYQFAIYPMLGQLANKLSINETILVDMCKEVQTNTFTIEDMGILENRTQFSGLLKINFEEPELGGGFHIVLAGSDQFADFVKNGVIAFLVNIIRKNVNLDSILKDAIRVKLQQTAAATTGQPSGTPEITTVEMSNWEFWISPLKKILIEYHSKNTLEKIFSKSFSNQYGNIEKIFLFIIKSVVISSRYFELRQMEEVEVKEREVGLEQDHIHMEKILVNSGKVIRDEQGTAISLFQPIPLNTFFYSKDRLGQKKLVERYSTTELNQIVEQRSPDKKHPRIMTVKDKQGGIYFIHIWRLIDVMLSMIQLETPGLTPKLLKKYTKDNFPPPEVPIVGEADLSPLFLSVYKMAMNVFSSFSTQQEGLDHLSPNLTEVNTYDLGSSEIGSMTNDTDLARSKYTTAVDFLFEEGNTNIPQPLEKVLGINRTFIEESLGVQKKTTKKYGLFNVAMNAVLNFIMFKWVSNLGKVAMNALENASSNEGVSNSQRQHSSRSQSDSIYPSTKTENKSVTKKALWEQIRDKMPSVPPSRKEIKELIEQQHDQWNVAVEDPQVYFPNWNEMGLLEKQRVHENLRKEIEKRRAVTRDMVDSSLVKYYSNLNMEGFDESKLDSFCENVAKGFKTNRPTQLRDYIKYYLLYMNTN